MLAGLAACEYPTEAPRWQTQWQVPAESASLGVKSFLPTGVTVNLAGTAFNVAVPAPAPVGTTLGTICGAACSAAATVPIPAFNNAGSPISGSVALPATTSSVTISGGAIDVTVTNNFSFDPLRPAGGGFGSVRFKLTAGGGTFTVADTTIGGAIGAMPPGVPTTFRIQLRNGTVPGGTFAYQVTVTCPGSSTTAAITPAMSFNVAPSVVGGSIALSKATVTLINQSVADSSAAFDLTNTNISTNALQSVGTVLRISNPFQVSAGFSITMTAPGVAPVSKSLIISPAANDSTPTNSTVTVNFTPAEFGQFLGKSGVRLKYSGTVTGSAPGNTVGVRPSHALTIKADVLAGILVGKVP